MAFPLPLSSWFRKLPIICSEKPTIFRERSSRKTELRGTDNVQGLISEHIFAPNGGYCLYYPSNIFRNACNFQNCAHCEKDLKDNKHKSPIEQWLCTCILNLCTFLCRSLKNNNVKWPNSASSGEREPRRLNFKIFISYLSLCFALSFEIVLTVINKVNDFRVSRDL